MIEAPDSTAAAAGEQSLAAGLSALWTNTRGLIRDSADLVALEARRAGLSAALMLALGVGAALLAVTAWLSLVAGVLLWVVDRGASWAGALLACAAINIVGGIVLGMLIRRYSRHLTFPATRRQLGGGQH